jgi:NAD(P)H-dependent FMN reductase
MFDLKIIISSTRPGRKCPDIAKWIFELAARQKEFSTELIDLKEINLPFFDEPEHPRLQKYTQPHSMAWSEKIKPADAFIIVTPEYNYGYIAPLKNALDFLYHEWSYKPVGFVSYGGIAAGTRAVQMLKQVLNAFKMVTLTTSVNIPSFHKYFDENNSFIANEVLNRSAESMLEDLADWTGFLREFREKAEKKQRQKTSA